MRIGPGFFGALLTGSRRWEIVFDEATLTYRRTSESPVQVALDAICIAATASGAIWSQIEIATPIERISCDGVLNRAATRFVSGLRGAVGQSLIGTINRNEAEVIHLAIGLTELLARPRYLAHRDIEEWRSKIENNSPPRLAHTLAVISNPLLPRELGSAELRKQVDLLVGVLSRAREHVTARNKRFVAQEILRHKSFFDSVERTPLTHEQRTAAVVMEDRNLLVAAAGSGKTSTVVGKIGYGLLTEQYEPSDFLVLAFNKAAAEELRERIHAQLRALLPGRAKVVVSTFHALGLDIIAKADGKKPSISNLAGVEEVADSAYIDQLIEQQIAVDWAFAIDWVTFRAVCAKPAKDPSEFNAIDDWDVFVQANGEYRNGKRGFLTIQGEVVKSQGELAIANWLYMQGVNYEYERPYEYDTANQEYRQYRPDFYLPDIDTYLEHYALDKNGRPPAAFGARYAESMQWKAQLHEEMATALITTTFADFVSGQLFSKLEEMLTTRGQRFAPRPVHDVLTRLNDFQKADYGGLIRTVLKHAKSNEIDEATLQARIDKSPQPFRARLFARVLRKLLAAHDARLRENGEIDFEDMIIRATRDVATNRYKHPYKVILVDEFQDISQSRAKLIKALLAQSAHCKLFAVGDDWQAIYRFAGSDIEIFANFEKHFGVTATSYLTQTFRSNQGISDVAAHFIQRNPSQLRKAVEAQDQTRAGAVVTRFYGNVSEAIDQYEAGLAEIAAGLPLGKRASVFLLARYRFQEPNRLASWRTQFRSLDITFKTAHSSKGLQADFVIVLNLSAGRFGFPSEITDDPLLQLVMPEPELFPNAEERRLFYVAMTRARHRVYLVGSSYAPSVFLRELREDPDLDTSTFSEPLGALRVAEPPPPEYRRD